jgi:hypothetical protein
MKAYSGTITKEAFVNEEGICPKWLAYLEDIIFEGISTERSESWPVEFAEAINKGSDLDEIKVPFLILVMENTLETVSKIKQTKEVKKSKEVILQTIEALKSGDKVLLKKAGAAARVADGAAAREIVRITKAAALESVMTTVAAAWAATGAAAWSASAAWSAWSEGTAEAAQWAAEAVNGTARTAVYELFADKLLELIKECK